MSEIQKPQLEQDGGGRVARQKDKKPIGEVIGDSIIPIGTALGVFTVPFVGVMAIKDHLESQPVRENPGPACGTLTNPEDIRECVFSEQAVRELRLGNYVEQDVYFPERFDKIVKSMREQVDDAGEFTYENARDIADAEVLYKAERDATAGRLSAYTTTGLIDTEGAITRDMADERIMEILGGNGAIEIGPVEEK